MDAKVYYHGSSDRCLSDGSYRLLPPVDTGVLAESGRKVRLDRVFFTRDLGLARIYAGRTVNRLGGRPVIVRVIVDARQVVCLSDQPGASVYHSPGAFCEPL